MEVQTMNLLKLTAEPHLHILEQNISMCNVSLAAFSAQSENHQIAVKSGNKYQRFLTNEKLKYAFRDFDAVLHHVKSRGYKPCLSFQMDDDINLNHLLKNETYICGDVYHNLFGHAQRFSTKMKIVSKRYVNIQIGSSRQSRKRSPNFLPSGALILCDINCEMLLVCDPAFKYAVIQERLGRIFFVDCCTVDDSTLAVCISERAEVPDKVLIYTMENAYKYETIPILVQDAEALLL